MHSRLAGGEAVLLHLETGAYHELNQMGAAIWELLDGNRTVGQIALEIRAKAEDVPEDIDDIVTGFIAQLRRRDLVR